MKTLEDLSREVAHAGQRLRLIREYLQAHEDVDARSLGVTLRVNLGSVMPEGEAMNSALQAYAMHNIKEWMHAAVADAQTQYEAAVEALQVHFEQSIAVPGDNADVTL